MLQTPAEFARLVTATTTRLRQLESDWASLPDTTRDDLIREEVTRASNEVVPDQREVFLKKLRQQFPAFDFSATTKTEQTPSAELGDSDFLVARLREATATMSPEQRRSVAMKLADAGLGLSGADTFPAPAVEALLQKAGIERTSTPIDPARAIETLARLADFTASIDQLVWTTWRQIARQSKLRRGNEIAKISGRYLVSDPDVTRADMVQDIERLRQLTASLISSVGRIGPQLTQRVLGKLNPEAIERIVEAERGGLLSNKEARCWRKFVELMATLDEATVEREVLQSVTDYTESLIRGLT